MIEAIRHWRNVNPQKKAVVFQDQSLTYEDLLYYSKNLADYLIRNQLNSTKAIGIYLPPCLELPIALLATWMTGAAYVPLDPLLPVQRISEIIEEVNLGCILAYDHSPLQTFEKAYSVPWIKIDEMLCKTSPSTRLPVFCLDSLAYIIFTSGTSGKPKGVEVTHTNVLNFLNSFAKILNISSADKFLAITSISFDIFGLEAFLPLYCGARTHLAEKSLLFEPNALIESMVKDEISILQATPSFFQMLIDENWPSLSLRHILCGGESWDSKLAATLLEKKPRDCALWNVYGPTETTIWSSAYQVRTPEELYLSPTINNTAFYVLDENLNQAKEGELYIGGDGVAKGYHHNDLLTRTSFIRNPIENTPSILYRTGDQVVHIDTNTYQFVGRKDLQVKIRGFRVELEDIENVLHSHPQINQAIVIYDYILYKDEKTLVACIQSIERDFSPDLRIFCSDRLASHMRPNHFIYFDKFPLTSSFKVDRKATLSMLKRQFESSSNQIQGKFFQIC